MNNPGILYVVATPLGNLGDMSPRAVEILKTVKHVMAEDTRHSSHLFTHFGIQTSLQSFHEHNEDRQIRSVLAHLKEGASMAVISDAGTPLISDPGFRLIQAARREKIQVVPIPGPCALIAALSVAGIPADRFIFEGFLPAKKAARCQRLEVLQEEMRTLIFYEAPHRILELLEDIEAVFGSERNVVLARELTKMYENVYGAPVHELLVWLQEDINRQKGEFVVLVEGAAKINKQEVDPKAQKILNILLKELSVKQAAKLTAEITGISKKQLYDWAVKKNKM